jgi:hypothetical protein
MFYEVEWCSSEGEQDGVDYDPDLCVYETKDFKTQEAAEKFAREILPKDVHGYVVINQFTREPYEPGYPATYKEYFGEPIEINS